MMDRIRKHKSLSLSAFLLTTSLALTACAPADNENVQEDNQQISVSPSSDSSTPSETASQVAEKKEASTEGSEALRTAINQLNETPYYEVSAKSTEKDNTVVTIIAVDNEEKKVSIKADGKVVDEATGQNTEYDNEYLYIQDDKNSYAQVNDSNKHMFPDLEVGQWVAIPMTNESSMFGESHQVFAPSEEDINKFKDVKGVEEKVNDLNTLKFTNEDGVSFWVDKSNGDMVKIYTEADKTEMLFSDIGNTEKSIEIPKDAVNGDDYLQESTESSPSASSSASSNG
mgnify:CR=1 FL=1